MLVGTRSKRALALSGGVTNVLGAMNVLNKYLGYGDISNLSQQQKMEIGIAIHTLQDTKVHKGTRWVWDNKDNTVNKNEHPDFQCGTGHDCSNLNTKEDYDNALKATYDIFKKILNTKYKYRVYDKRKLGNKKESHIKVVDKTSVKNPRFF